MVENAVAPKIDASPAGSLRVVISVVDHFAALVGNTAAIVTTVALVAELVVLFLNVMLRWLTGSAILWSGEVAEICLEVLTFVGGAVAYQRGQHLAVRTLRNRLSAGAAEAIDAASDLIVLSVSVGALVLAQPLLDSAAISRTPVLGISRMWLMVPLLVGLGLIALFAVQRLAHAPRFRPFVAAVFGVGGALAAVMALHAHGGSLVRPAPWLAVALFVGALAIGVPIGFTLGATALLYLYASGKVDPTAVPLTMQGSVDNFILLAVPFFILAGYVMTAGGLSEPLGSFVSSLVGQFRGGLLQVIVVTMYIFSGISGSKTADVAAVGTAMRSELDRQGYERSESVAVLTSAAIMGETVPPSIALLILASLTSLSVGSLFLAGLFPAAVVGVCLMAGIYLRARSGRVAPSVERVGWRMRSVRLFAAIPALAVPLILAGGILSGIATPTEASSIAVVYAVVVSVGLYRVRSPRLFAQLASTSAAMSGMILFIYSTASGLSWTVTAAGLVSKLATTLLGITHSQPAFLLGTVVLLIVMGALLEGVPALVVLAPLLVPLAPDYGVDPLHYGIVMIIAMGFGSFLPPLGLGVYVAASIYEVDLDRVARRMVPYLVAVFVGLLLVTYVPWFTTFVPGVFNNG